MEPLAPGRFWGPLFGFYKTRGSHSFYTKKGFILKKGCLPKNFLRENFWIKLFLKGNFHKFGLGVTLWVMASGTGFFPQFWVFTVGFPRIGFLGDVWALFPKPPAVNPVLGELLPKRGF